MRVLKNQSILQRQSENYIKGELSNVATVVQSPQLLTEYFSIDPDLSPTMEGFRNVEDFISPNSSVIYNQINDLPMSGIDNLVTQSQFDEEIGFDEDLQSNGIIFPNTVMPKPNDCFMINGSQVTALYVVTNISPVTVRSNPFVEISFRLFSRDPEVIKQLRRQVKKKYLTTVTAIGADKTLVVEQESYFDIQKHVEDYLGLLDLYETLFWDRERAAFIFDGLYDEKSERKLSFLDVTLWKLMFDERIIIFDDVVTYANNNFSRTIDRIYTSCPDPYLDNAHFKRSILWRIYNRDKKNQIDEYKFPQGFEPDPRVGKFTGKNIIYFEYYGQECDCNLMCTTCPTWDEEFVLRIKNNDPYPLKPLNYTGEEFCNGEPVKPFNPYLRNAIIHWYNGDPIDWENLDVVEEKTCENYFLIPLLLGAYKQFIHDLQT